MALGGAIGTGLFLASGLSVNVAGPAIILSYVIVAAISLLLGRALTDMAVAHPTAGSFGVWAGVYLSPFAGYAVRISYAMNANNALEFPKPETRKLSAAQAGSPATTVLIADVQHAYNHPPLRVLDPSQVGYRHDRRANMQFFDGHTAAMAPNETNRITLDF